MSEPALVLRSDGLLSKWGFNDGDEPDAFLDYLEEHGLTYPTNEQWTATLRRLVRDRLLPALEQRVDVVEVETAHNPIRARSVDDADVADQWTMVTPSTALRPEFVTVPFSDVLGVLNDVKGRGPT